MSRKRVGALALLLYPREIRAERGHEMLGTLLDAGDVSLPVFIAQLGSVITGALGARSRQALRVPPGRLAEELLCWLALIAMIRYPLADGFVLLQLGIPMAPLTIVDSVALPVLVLLSFTLGARRLVGLLGLALTAIWTKEHPWIWAQPEFQTITETLVLPLIGFGLMLVRPRSVPANLRGLWVLPALSTFAMVMLLQPASTELGAVAIRLLPPVLIALTCFAIAPAFALAITLAWATPFLTTIDGSRAPGIMLVALVPLTLVAVAATRHRVMGAGG